MDFTLKSDENHTLVSVSLSVRDPPRVSWHKQDWARDMVFQFCIQHTDFPRNLGNDGKIFFSENDPSGRRYIKIWLKPFGKHYGYKQ